MLARWGAEVAAYEGRARTNGTQTSTYRVRLIGHRLAAEVAWSEGREVLAGEHERAARLLVEEMRQRAWVRRQRKSKTAPLLDATGTGG